MFVQRTISLTSNRSTGELLRMPGTGGMHVARLTAPQSVTVQVAFDTEGTAESARLTLRTGRTFRVCFNDLWLFHPATTGLVELVTFADGEGIEDAGAEITGAMLFSGNGSPEGVIVAEVGDIYLQRDAATTSHPVWIKRSGTGNTGWRAMGGFRGPATESIEIGDDAVASGHSSIAMGRSADATDGSAVAIGYNAQATQFGVVAIGRQSQAELAHLVSLGASDADNWHELFRFGHEQTLLSVPPDTTWYIHSALAALNRTGCEWIFQASRSTGNAAARGFKFRTGTVGASGAALQAVADRFQIQTDKLHAHVPADLVGATAALREYRSNGTKVLGDRITGWTAPTGTASRAGYATATATLTQVAETLKALIDDLFSHGLIGP